jgi:DNA-binding IclR family transcriptional regulator
MQLLKAFDHDHPEWSVADLGARFGYRHRSTVSRLMTTLAADGLVQWNPESGCYRLGLVVLELAGVLTEQLDIREAARPAMRELCRRSGETVSLDVLQDGETVVIDQITSPSSVRYVCWVGRRVPVHASSAGKVLLAFQRPEDAAQLLRRLAGTAGVLPRYTAKTHADLAVLRQELQHVRHCGVATAAGEVHDEIAAAAAPVFDHQGDVVAAVAVNGPTFRLTAARLAELAPDVVLAGAEISRRLGHPAAGAP